MTRIAQRRASWIAIAAALALLVFVALSGSSRAHSTTNLTLLSKERTSFENWDFESRNVSSGNVDWPFTLLFYNSTQTKVNDQLNGDYPNGGDPEHARMYETYFNNNQYFWDENSGRKNSLAGCVATDAAHYRVYARPGIGYLYNTSWGTFTVATTHRDHWECVITGGTWYGFSNDAENNVAASARKVGLSVAADSHKWHNPEYCPTRTDPYSMHGACVLQGDGYLQSDGYATAIYLK